MQREAKTGFSKMALRTDSWKRGEGRCGEGPERELVEARWVSWASEPALEAEVFELFRALPSSASALG